MSLKTAKKLCVGFLVIFSVLMVVMMLTTNPSWGYAAIVVMGAYGAFHHCCWRCPRCGKNLGPLWIKHCPHCGNDLSQ